MEVRTVAGDQVAALLVSHSRYTPQQAADEVYRSYRDGAALVWQGSTVRIVPLGAWRAWHAPSTLTSRQAIEAIVAIAPDRLGANSARKAMAEAREHGYTVFYLPWLHKQSKSWLRVTYVSRNSYIVDMIRKPK